MNRMIQLAAIALIAIPLATAAAKAEHGRIVHATTASASAADVVVNQGSHHRCRGWHRFCFGRPW